MLCRSSVSFQRATERYLTRQHRHLRVGRQMWPDVLIPPKQRKLKYVYDGNAPVPSRAVLDDEIEDEERTSTSEDTEENADIHSGSDTDDDEDAGDGKDDDDDDEDEELGAHLQHSSGHGGGNSEKGETSVSNVAEEDPLDDQNARSDVDSL